MSGLLAKYGHLSELAFANLGERPPSPRSREAKDVQRHHVIQELRATEREFIADCEIMVQVFQADVLRRGLLSEEQAAEVFQNVGQIAAASKELLKVMEKAVAGAKNNIYSNAQQRAAIRSEMLLIGPVFTQLARNLYEMYSPYCCGQYRAGTALQRYVRELPAFALYLDEMQLNPISMGQTLASFLIKPVQRICKYPLLLRELLKATPVDHPDKETLVEAYLSIEKTVADINDSRALSETLLKLDKLAKQVAGFQATGLSSEQLGARRYTNEIVLFYQPGRKKKLLLSLWVVFTDLLLGLTPAKAATYRAPVDVAAADPVFDEPLEIIAWLPLTLALVKPHADDPTGRGLPFPLELVHAGKVKYLLYAAKLADHQRFVDALSPPAAAAPDRRPRTGSIDSPRTLNTRLSSLSRVSAKTSPLRSTVAPSPLSFSQRLRTLYK